MEEFIKDPAAAAAVVFITQVVFLYFRTLNVIYNAKGHMVGTIVTGNVIGAAWLISVSIGVSAIITMEWMPILGYFLGGTLGVYMGLKKKK